MTSEWINRFDLPSVLYGAGLSFIIGVVSYKLKALSRSGAFGMIIIGTIVFGLGGVIFAVPLIFFFVSSSLFSMIKTPIKERSMIAFDKIGPRDIWQTLANGGVAAVCVLIYFFTGNIFWYFPFLASLCEAAADTWATELGTLSSAKSISIVSLKKVELGRSGGITLVGTLASAAGSLAVMTSVCLIWPGIKGLPALPLGYYLAAANAGFAGSLLDSILGGSIQGHCHCAICGRITERKIHCGTRAEQAGGLAFINNDMVNLAGTLFAAATVAVMLL